MAVDYGVLASPDGLLPGIGQAIAKIIAARERRKDREYQAKLRNEERAYQDKNRADSRSYAEQQQAKEVERTIKMEKAKLGLPVGDPTYDDIGGEFARRRTTTEEAASAKADLERRQIESLINDRITDNARQQMGQWGQGIKNTWELLNETIRTGRRPAQRPADPIVRNFGSEFAPDQRQFNYVTGEWEKPRLAGAPSGQAAPYEPAEPGYALPNPPRSMMTPQQSAAEDYVNEMMPPAGQAQAPAAIAPSAPIPSAVVVQPVKSASASALPYAGQRQPAPKVATEAEIMEAARSTGRSPEQIRAHLASRGYSFAK